MRRVVTKAYQPICIPRTAARQLAIRGRQVGTNDARRTDERPDRIPGAETARGHGRNVPDLPGAPRNNQVERGDPITGTPGQTNTSARLPGRRRPDTTPDHPRHRA